MRFGKVPTWQDFLVFGGWMDGITKERLTGMEILAGFDARLKGMGGKEKVGEGSFV